MSAAAATSAVTNANVDFYEFKEKEKDTTKTNLAQVSAPSASTGQLDSSVVQSDQQRRAQLVAVSSSQPVVQRKPFLHVIVNPQAHLSAVDAYQPLYGSKAKYCQYLRNVAHDVLLLEALLLKTNPQLTTLPKLYRTAAIRLDMAKLEAAGDLSECMATNKHAEHIVSLDGKPHRILFHLGVQYLGFLFGGQSIAAQIKKSWGDGAISLYTYEVLPRTMFETFAKEMTEYLMGLSDGEYQEFVAENAKAWLFANDHLA